MLVAAKRWVKNFARMNAIRVRPRGGPKTANRCGPDWYLSSKLKNGVTKGRGNASYPH